MEEKDEILSIIQRFPEGVTSGKLRRISGFSENSLKKTLVQLVSEDRVSTSGFKRQANGNQDAIWMVR